MMADSTRETAGFPSRFAALIMDTIVLFPLAFLLGKLLEFPREVASLGAVVYALMYPLYNILLLGIVRPNRGETRRGHSR
jgi:hypothetical protein